MDSSKERLEAHRQAIDAKMKAQEQMQKDKLAALSKQVGVLDTICLLIGLI